MTAWMLFGAVRRHRLVTLLGVLLTVGASVWASSVSGVYYQRVSVIFLAPKPPENVNAYQFVGSSLIAAASIIRLEVADDAQAPQPVSPKVTIVDQGVTHGSTVRMPNSGGQWANVFERPVLDVQIVGSSPDEVNMSMRALLRRIEKRLADDQSAFGVAADRRIDTTLSPPRPPILYRRGSQARAVAVTTLLGIGVTLSLVVALDRSLARRMIRRPRVSA